MYEDGVFYCRCFFLYVYMYVNAHAFPIILSYHIATCPPHTLIPSSTYDFPHSPPSTFPSLPIITPPLPTISSSPSQNTQDAAPAPTQAEADAQAAADSATKDPTKFVGKKSKAVAKSGSASTQWGIMKASGLSDDEIPAFR